MNIRLLIDLLALFQLFVSALFHGDLFGLFAIPELKN